MPYLPDAPSTQALIKNLTIDLYERCSGADLGAYGWFQYRDYDHLKTCVSTEFASHAFMYLSLDQRTEWRNNIGVLKAVFAFLSRYHNIQLQPQSLEQLKQLLQSKPVNGNNLSQWFLVNYPPRPQP